MSFIRPRPARPPHDRPAPQGGSSTRRLLAAGAATTLTALVLVFSAPLTATAATDVASLPCAPAGSDGTRELIVKPRPRVCLVRSRHVLRGSDLRRLTWRLWGQPTAYATARLYGPRIGRNRPRPSEHVIVGADKLVLNLCDGKLYYSRLRIVSERVSRTIWLAPGCVYKTYADRFFNRVDVTLKRSGAKDVRVKRPACEFGAPGLWRCSAGATWQQTSAAPSSTLVRCVDIRVPGYFKRFEPTLFRAPRCKTGS